MRKWFEIKAETDGTTADVYIFDIVGDWIDDLFGFDGVTTAKSFVDELAKLPATVKTLRVRINSPGGDAFGGLTIANSLRAEQARGRKVETIIEGLAASAASVIAMGGNPVRIADNGLLMVHAPWSVAVGNAREMRATADILDQMRDSALVKTYQWHSKLSADEIVALIDGKDGQGTWLDADAAIAAGFATEKIEGLKAAASLDPRAVSKLSIPEKFRDRVQALIAKPAPAPEPPAAANAAEVLKLCREGECLALAEELVRAGATLEQVQARVAGAKDARTQARCRETEIRGLCAAARLPELADGYIAGGMAPAEARAQLTLVTAKLDKVEIDAGLEPDPGARKKPVIDVVAVYAELNQLPQAKKE